MDEPQLLPRWAMDLARFLPLKSHFVLSGNVRDRYPWPISDDRYVLLALRQFLAELLKKHGV